MPYDDICHSQRELFPNGGVDNIGVGLCITHSVCGALLVPGWWFGFCGLHAFFMPNSKRVPHLFNPKNNYIMERYRLDLKLPKIVRLYEVPRCEREEYGLIGRDIFLHTPSGIIVEIIEKQDILLDEKYFTMPFCDKCPNGVTYQYIAVLLQNPKEMKAKESKEVMKIAITWFLKHMSEYLYIDSLPWVNHPDELQ